MIWLSVQHKLLLSTSLYHNTAETAFNLLQRHDPKVEISHKWKQSIPWQVCPEFVSYSWQVCPEFVSYPLQFLLHFYSEFLSSLCPAIKSCCIFACNTKKLFMIKSLIQNVFSQLHKSNVSHKSNYSFYGGILYYTCAMWCVGIIPQALVLASDNWVAEQNPCKIISIY